MFSNLIKIRVEDLNEHFSKEDNQMANIYETMLNITNYQGSANQNHDEILPHTYQNGTFNKTRKRKSLNSVGGNMN